MRLPTDVYSPDQVSALTMELRTFIDAQADASRRSDHGGGEPQKSALLQSAFEATDSQNAHQLLEELDGLLKHAPVVHIITAALPGRDLKRQITFWFRREIHENTLVTFAERRDLGGGIIIRAGSQIYDFSLKHKILDNKHRITEIAFPPQSTGQPQSAPQTRQGAANV